MAICASSAQGLANAPKSPSKLPGQRPSSFSKYSGKNAMQREWYSCPALSGENCSSQLLCTNVHTALAGHGPRSGRVFTGEIPASGMQSKAAELTWVTHAYGSGARSMRDMSCRGTTLCSMTRQLGPSGMTQALPSASSVATLPVKTGPSPASSIANCSNCGA